MNFNGLVPELSVSNIQNSKEFYLDVLGFKLEYERVNDKFSFISLGNAQIMLEEINGYWNTDVLKYPFGRGINFQITVTNVSLIENRLKESNIPLFRDVFESEYECNGSLVVQKELLVQDPDGYLLRLSQLIER